MKWHLPYRVTTVLIVFLSIFSCMPDAEASVGHARPQHQTELVLTVEAPHSIHSVQVDSATHLQLSTPQSNSNWAGFLIYFINSQVKVKILQLDATFFYRSSLRLLPQASSYTDEASAPQV